VFMVASKFSFVSSIVAMASSLPVILSAVIIQTHPQAHSGNDKRITGEMLLAVGAAASSCAFSRLALVGHIQLDAVPAQPLCTVQRLVSTLDEGAN